MYTLQCDEDGLITGTVCFRRPGTIARLKPVPAAVSILSGCSRGRSETESFIRDIYARSYGARISVHYPLLISLSDENGLPLAAAGFRPANGGRLFLEQYLDRPVEDLLGVARDRIVEIGNLASVGGYNTPVLFLALSGYLHYRGYRQAVITGTDFLQKRLCRMGLEPKCLATADAARLAGTTGSWGSYYDRHPRVYSGPVENGYQRLLNLLGADYTTVRQSEQHPLSLQREALGP